MKYQAIFVMNLKKNDTYLLSATVLIVDFKGKETKVSGLNFGLLILKLFNKINQIGV